MDRNDVYLQGTIGDDFKYGKAESGFDYATFSLVVEASQFAKDKGSEAVTYIRIMVFKHYLVKYLKAVGARRGNKVNVWAFINSHKSEIKGQSIIQNNVIARDICIIKTQSTQQT